MSRCTCLWWGWNFGPARKIRGFPKYHNRKPGKTWFDTGHYMTPSPTMQKLGTRRAQVRVRDGDHVRVWGEADVFVLVERPAPAREPVRFVDPSLPGASARVHGPLQEREPVLVLLQVLDQVQDQEPVPCPDRDQPVVQALPDVPGATLAETCKEIAAGLCRSQEAAHLLQKTWWPIPSGMLRNASTINSAPLRATS